jgi:hypothetical protein
MRIREFADVRSPRPDPREGGHGRERITMGIRQTKRMAVALVQHAPDDDQQTRSRRRVALSTAAHEAGWVLLELYELDGNLIRDALTLCALEDHADRTGVRDLVVPERIRLRELQVLTRRARLRVRVLESHWPPN